MQIKSTLAPSAQTPAQKQTTSTPSSGRYPAEETVQRAYYDADLNRSIQAFRFLYPTVSAAAIRAGNESVGIFANKNALVMARRL
jgi:hypothetical protein